MRFFALLVACLCFTSQAFGQLHDPRPLVLTGSDIPTALINDNLLPGELRAFVIAEGVKKEIPVQVDERDLVNVGLAYIDDFNLGQYRNVPEMERVFYTGSPGNVTLIPSDTNGNIDDNDEISLMIESMTSETIESSTYCDGSGSCNPIPCVGDTYPIQATDINGATKYAYLYKV
ncbi:MAG: hypothetical protein AAFX41_09220, partial [Bacteroidota bacterium]